MEIVEPSIRDALAAVRTAVEGARFPLDAADSIRARRARGEVLAQLDDYILPRLDTPDAPLLAVVGGSTGAGKSTLVNSLVGRPVSQTGVLRPTTRSPVLVHHPDDAEWFAEPRILPGLARVDTDDKSGVALRLAAEPGLPSGVAVLDAPDVDSVVSGNRELAAELLAAADLWVFVTTAARYSDAVPWDFLTAAAKRHAAVAVVLDRVGPDAVSEVRTHLSALLADHGLGDAPLFVVEETDRDESGMLPEGAAAAVRDWLHGLAADESTRAEIAQRTLGGAVDDLLGTVQDLADAADQQADALAALQAELSRVFEAAAGRIDTALSDGSVLPGAVLGRWHDFLDRGEFLRTLDETPSRVREAANAFLRHRTRSVTSVEDAITRALSALVVEEANRAAEDTERSWRDRPEGRSLLGAGELSRASAHLPGRCGLVVREWQQAVQDMVGTEAAGQSAPDTRLLPSAVRGLSVALQIVVLAPRDLAEVTAQVPGPDGSVLAGRILAGTFGDEAVRRLAAKARSDLRGRIEAQLAAESVRFGQRLGDQPVEAGTGEALRAATVAVQQARGDAE